MAAFEGTLAEHMTLVDMVDHLLNRGVVLSGGATLSLAGVDLVYVGLNLLVASVETLQRGEGPEGRLPISAAATQGLIRPRGSRRPGSDVARGLVPRQTSHGGGQAPALREPGAVDALRAAESEWYSEEQLAPAAPAPPGDPAQPARPERDLARLVLTLVELLRQLLERQAVRRMEGGSLSDQEVERMGLALQELETRLVELRTVFGLEEGDLNIDLGPLGQLT